MSRNILIITLLAFALLVPRAQGSIEDCVNYLEGLPGSPSLTSVIFNSGKNINDMGSFDACKKIPDNRFFVLSSINTIGSLNIALCLSKKCTVDDVYAILAKNGLSVINGAPVVVIETEEQKSQLDGGGITTIVIISSIGLLALLAPASRFLKYLSGAPEQKGKPLASRPEEPLLNKADGKVETLPKKSKLSLLSFVECFSIDKNFDKFTNLPPKTPLTFLNGIRSLSLFWVIYGHEFLNRIFLLSNTNSIPKVLSSASFLMYTGAFFAVDVFFWMSGFLFSYLILEAKSAKYLKMKFIL